MLTASPAAFAAALDAMVAAGSGCAGRIQGRNELSTVDEMVGVAFWLSNRWRAKAAAPVFSRLKNAPTSLLELRQGWHRPHTQRREKGMFFGTGEEFLLLQHRDYTFTLSHDLHGPSASWPATKLLMVLLSRIIGAAQKACSW